MEISKLTITPIMSGVSEYVAFKPTSNMASILMKERLSCNYFNKDSKIPRALRKIPKALQGFVNPRSKVLKNRNFNTVI